MRIVLIIVICLTALLFSCSKEEMSQPEDRLQCYGTASKPFLLPDCDSLTTNSEFFCELQPLGEFAISDDSKNFLPYYCNSIGDVFEFKSASGEKKSLVLTQKQYRQTQSIHNLFEECSSVEDKYIGYCLFTDLVIIELTDPESERIVEVQLKVAATRNPSTDEIVISDNLSLLQETEEFFRLIEFSAYLENGEINNDLANVSLFSESIQLAGVEFNDVISRSPILNINSEREYYFNSGHGIIGFISSEGEEFALVQ